MAAVLRLLKGEDLDALSRELKVNAATLSSRRELFLANGLTGLKSREIDSRDERITQLHSVPHTFRDVESPSGVRIFLSADSIPRL